MSAVQIRTLGIEGVREFTPPVHQDDRGCFSSPYQDAAFTGATGRPLFPVKDISHNLSAGGVLRGIHYTATPPGRAKYVYCPYGQVRDFVVDLRVGSPTFGRWEVTELSGENCRALYIPVGVGHAFLSLRDDSMVVYVMSEGYVPEHEQAVSPLDPALGLPLPAGPAPRLSDRDGAAPTLAEARDQGLLPTYDACREVEAALWP
ncbi:MULTISPECIES: dTDP-4-dehydrorhamnose 3,5-epimerase family protein [unclassified Streptomyces]|uniref:dTDP-4-dehydrorhamnose 3,5-epimerase family protein n=1 Tax=unclassified Streptomyces TaxID=2593676 RepID=UPI002E7950BF|nr:dTDP-4-dehydrorhamnose 3,5-epimerase family protein [Streptomyces sp. JV176]MEE1798981.1 dTDP-4-dehydrorhamnose 3,5-epimerase family protein [Streptomyces sp. JV176]